MRCVLNLNTVTLWAMWYTKYGPTTMQGWKGCGQLQTNQTITLTDARDNNQYTVAKLTDGKCWMTQNLRIQGEKNLTAEDTDITSDFRLPQSSTSNWGSNTPLMFFLNNTYGGYYNWYAATANSNVIGNKAQGSICPKGWRLPDFFKEMDYIFNHYDLGRSSPANFILGGRYVTCENVMPPANPNYFGSFGWFWSSEENGGSAYALMSGYSGHVFDACNNMPIKPAGISVRCLQR